MSGVPFLPEGWRHLPCLLFLLRLLLTDPGAPGPPRTSGESILRSPGATWAPGNILLPRTTEQLTQPAAKTGRARKPPPTASPTCLVRPPRKPLLPSGFPPLNQPCWWGPRTVLVVAGGRDVAWQGVTATWAASVLGTVAVGPPPWSGAGASASPEAPEPVR